MKQHDRKFTKFTFNGKDHIQVTLMLKAHVLTLWMLELLCSEQLALTLLLSDTDR